MRDRLQICVRVRSERLRGLPVAREALVWSVRSLRAAGAEVQAQRAYRSCVRGGGYENIPYYTVLTFLSTLQTQQFTAC